MPRLEWDGKTPAKVNPTNYRIDSTIHPQGVTGSSKTKVENSLIFGDNLQALATLVHTHAGAIRLIYIDPPFFTNRKFQARLGREEDSRKPEKWQLAEGYGDQWQTLDDYLTFLYQRLLLMKDLLAEDGTLYLHLDWHADSYARVLLDEIFGQEFLLNEIIWTYHGPSPIRSAFNRKHDVIYSYTKSEKYLFNADAVRTPYDESTRKTFNSSPKAGFGKVPDLDRGKVPEDWWYFPVVARLHGERTGYPTQKPQALLERIIKASSNQGDLVADFFSGSGTTAVAAANLGRRFLAVDATQRAINTAHERLVRAKSSPFNIMVPQDAPSRATSSRLVYFAVKNNSISLTQPDDVVYWEIDTKCIEGVFTSTIQSQTHNRKDEVQTDLPLPDEIKKITARAIFKDGNIVEQVIQRSNV